MSVSKPVDESVVLITGAARGIGRATMQTFAAAGANVFATDLAEIAPDGGVTTHAGDIATDEGVRDAIDSCVEAYGGLDGIVHCAGILNLNDLAATTISEWDAVLGVNVRSGFLLLQHGVPRLLERGGGCITLLGSISGQNGGVVCGPAYAASKGAVHALVKWAARNYAGAGIRVNAIAPGPVHTDMSEAASMSGAHVPLGRLGRAEEIGQLAVYLASDAGSWITGQVLGINGGLLI